jgi:hypothetical protein
VILGELNESKTMARQDLINLKFALSFLCQVAQLKAAGAIVLAKTNMAEWAYTNAVSIGSAFGIVRNPYDLDRVTAGRLFSFASSIIEYCAPHH